MAGAVRRPGQWHRSTKQVGPPEGGVEGAAGALGPWVAARGNCMHVQYCTPIRGRVEAPGGTGTTGEIPRLSALRLGHKNAVLKD